MEAGEAGDEERIVRSTEQVRTGTRDVPLRDVGDLSTTPKRPAGSLLILEA